jgi:hypothetical protein
MQINELLPYVRAQYLTYSSTIAVKHLVSFYDPMCDALESLRSRVIEGI